MLFLFLRGETAFPGARPFDTRSSSLTPVIPPTPQNLNENVFLNIELTIKALRIEIQLDECTWGTIEIIRSN